MEEVIATSSKEVRIAPIANLVLGILMLVAGIVLFALPLDNFTFLEGLDAEILIAKIVLFIGGAIAIFFAVFTWTRAKNTPVNVIVFNNGVLKFADGFSCKIEEVQTVRCAPDVHYGNDTILDAVAMGTSSTGSLTVVVGGSERVYRKIENVKDANDKLIKLMLECREKGKEGNG